MITIVIPALNEAEYIGLTVQGIHRVLTDKIKADFKIIVFNDGSTDNTENVALDAAKALNNVEVHTNSVRQGLGKCFLHGLKYARQGHLILLPGDNAYNADSLVGFFSSIQENKISFGYRKNQFSNRPYYKVLISYSYNYIINKILGFRLVDVHGPVAFPVEKLNKLKFKAPENMFQIDAIYNILKQGCEYTEVPVFINKEKGRQTKSGISFKAFNNIFLTLWMLKIRS